MLCVVEDRISNDQTSIVAHAAIQMSKPSRVVNRAWTSLMLLTYSEQGTWIGGNGDVLKATSTGILHPASRIGMVKAAARSSVPLATPLQPHMH